MRYTLLHTALGAVFAATATMASLALAAPPVMSAGSAPFASPPLTAPGKNKLKCFDGPSEGAPQGGSCTMQGNGAKGPAILDVSSTDPDGDYAGVYYQESSIHGAALGDIRQLGFHYVASDSAIAPGNLSLNIPIDEDGDGVTEQYAFIDVFYCPGTDGVVDALHDEECGIWYDGVQYENWDALVDEYPDALVATDNFAFVIAERTPTDNAASYRVNAVKIGKPGR
jgi:hypothetical protein